jgi:hypothetical protein
VDGHSTGHCKYEWGDRSSPSPVPSEKTEVIKADNLFGGDIRNFIVKFHVQVGSKRSRFNPCDLSVDFPSRYHTNFDEQADGIRGKPSISETGLSRDNLGHRLALRFNHNQSRQQDPN